MKLSEIRNQFLIYVVDSELSAREFVSESLKSVGYTVECFSRADTLLETAPKQPPHLVISGTYLTGMTGLQLQKELKELSTDIGFIYMATYAEAQLAIEALEQGAYDKLLKPFSGIVDVVHVIDRYVEKLALQTALDEIGLKLHQKKKLIKAQRNQIKNERDQWGSLIEASATFDSSKDLSDLIQNYINRMSLITNNKPVAFLRYLEHQKSLIISNVSSAKIESLKGTSIIVSDEPDLWTEKPRSILLQELVRQHTQKSQYTLLTHETEDKKLGATLIFDSIAEPFTKKAMIALNTLFQSVHAHLHTKKLLHSSLIKDPMTGLLSKAHFVEMADVEVKRARRIEMPVSVLMIGIDKFEILKENAEPHALKSAIKALAHVIHKTSRSMDIIGRMSESEFAILLPHTEKLGAAIKAEKLRRLIEKSSFGEQLGLSIRLSIGISEYPSLSSDVQSMLESADSAYFQVKRVGNKVCVASAPKGHQPDFGAQSWSTT